MKKSRRGMEEARDSRKDCEKLCPFLALENEGCCRRTSTCHVVVHITNAVIGCNTTVVVARQSMSTPKIGAKSQWCFGCSVRLHNILALWQEREYDHLIW